MPSIFSGLDVISGSSGSSFDSTIYLSQLIKKANNSKDEIDLLQELCQKHDKLHELMMGTMLVIGLDNRTNNVINDFKSKINNSDSSDKKNQTE